MHVSYVIYHAIYISSLAILVSVGSYQLPAKSRASELLELPKIASHLKVDHGKNIMIFASAGCVLLLLQEKCTHTMNFCSEMGQAKHVSGKNLFCSMNVYKSREKRNFEIVHWPFELPPIQQQPTSPFGWHKWCSLAQLFLL